MIEIYAKNFKRNKGNLITEEQLILSIPTTQSITGLPIQNPKVKVEMGKSESFDFAIETNSDLYHGVIQNRTMFRVEYDGNTIFYGRVITIDFAFRSKNQTVHCEGPLSFLLDSYYKATKETSRSKISLNAYITNILSDHRWYVADGSRDIWPGEIPGGYSNSINDDQQISNETEKFGVSSWTETKSALEDVRGYYGGYLRTRYSGGYVYLDWLKDYFRDQTANTCQQIELRKNLIDYSIRTEVSNIFTAIIPVGKDGLTLAGFNGSSKSSEVWHQANHDNAGTGNWIVVPAICQIYSDVELETGYHHAWDYHQALDTYGWIYRTVSFSNAGTKAKLFSEATAWIKKNFYPYVDTYTFKAIDMRMLGENTDPILVGDKRMFGYPSSDGSAVVNQTLTVISAEYDLYNLENTSYKVGIPSELLTKMWNTKSGAKTTGNSTDPKGNTGDNEQTASEEYDDWMARVKRFLMLHDVPGSDPSQPYYIPGVGGMFGQLYNSLTGQWEYLDDHDGLTYEEVRSRGLVSWIPLHDEPEDAAEWKSIIYGYNDDNKTPYLDMLRETFKSKNVPGSSPVKAILSEDESEIYNPVIDQWVHINEFSLALVESLDLYEWYYNNFGVDLRDESAIYSVTEEEKDPETGETTSKKTTLFTWVFDKVSSEESQEILRKKKLFIYDWVNNHWEFFDSVAGIPKQIFVESYSTEWVNTKDSIGQMIKKTVVDGEGNVTYVVDAGKLLLSVRNNPDTGVEETLADIMADTVDVRANNKITLALNNTDAAFVLSKLEGMDGNQKGTLASLIADQIDARANNKITLALNNTDAAFVLSKLQNGTTQQKETLAQLVADHITLTAEDINLDGTKVINLINNNEGLTINAAKVNLNGYLTASGISAGTQTVSHFHCTGSIQSDTYVLAGDYKYGNQESLLDAFVSVTKTESSNQITLTFHRAQSQSEDQSVTFSKAASLTRNWDGNTFYVYSGTAQSYTDEKHTTYAGVESTGATYPNGNNNKSILHSFNIYFDETTGSQGTEYGKIFTASLSVNAEGPYNAGWRAAYGQFDSPTTTPATIPNNISVYYPNSQPDGTAPHRDYYLTCDNSNVYLKYGQGSDAPVVAQITNTAYDAGKSYATTNLDVIDNGNNKVDVTLDGTTVTTYSHNKYTLGQNSIKIAKSWSGGIATLTKSTASTLPTSQEIRLTSATTWNGNVATVAIWDGLAPDAQQGGVSTGYTVTVNAQSIYNDGFDDVTFTGVSWGTATQSGSTIYVDATTSINPKKVGTDTARTNTTRLYLIKGSWESGSLPVYLRSAAANGTERASISVSMPSTADITGSYNASTDKYDITVTAGGKEYTGAINPTRPIQPQDITASELTAVTTTTGLTSLGTINVTGSGTTKYATTISSVKGFYFTVDGTDAYAAGWNAAVSGTSMPGSYSTSTTINVRLPSTTVDGELRTRQYVIGADATYAYLQYLRSSDSQYVTVCRVTHNQYNLGWHAAYDVNGLPSAYATNSYMTVTMPGSSPGNTITRRYYVGADSSYAYIQYLRESDSQYVTVARIPNTGGSSGTAYNNGWIAAYNQVTLPTTASTANSYIDIITPKSTPGSYPPATSRYTLSADTSYVYLKYGTVTVARADNTGYQSAYEAGFQEGWTRCLNPYYSYWWAGTETVSGVNWWDVCRPKATAWRYALQGESAYQAAKQADWQNVGEYWGDACLELTGQETHSYRGSIAQVYETDVDGGSSSADTYYGKLYYYYNGGYHSVTTKNCYWFYSGSDIGGGNVYR